eukprot:541876-Rhodomonas_salina.1
MEPTPWTLDPRSRNLDTHRTTTSDSNTDVSIAGLPRGRAVLAQPVYTHTHTAQETCDSNAGLPRGHAVQC